MERIASTPPEDFVAMDNTFWWSVLGTVAFIAVIITYVL